MAHGGGIQIKRCLLAYHAPSPVALRGIQAAGPRLAYLLMHAELEELICSGPRRGKQQTYALLDDRVPPSPSDDRPRATAVADLARVACLAPAAAQDPTGY